MAVVFISPKQRQKVFFMGITVVFLLFLIIVFLGVFLSKPKQVLKVQVFNKSKVSIDMKIFDTDQFKRLQPFVEMETQYSYKIVEKDGKVETGFMSANSAEQVRKILEGRGLTVSDIKETEIGRENPFTPYYQDSVVVLPSAE